MNELLRAIAEHLTFFGYQVAPLEGDPQVPIGTFSAVHTTRPMFWVLPIGQGAFFRALFRVSPIVAQDPLGFLSFLNDANAACLVARYWQIQNALAICAWYFGAHDRERFDIFFQQYSADMGVGAVLWPERAARYTGAQNTPAVEG